MVRTAIQLYTLRNLDRPLSELLELVGETSFDGVEFAGLDGTDAELVSARLAETRLSVAGAHVQFEQLTTNFDDAVETYRAIGCDTLVVPWLDNSHFESVSAVCSTAETLNDLADRLDARNLRLCYHNHDQEFVDLGDATEEGEGDAFDLLVAETDDRVGFELDVGWVVATGRDPTALLENLSGRVPLVHFKDVDADTGRTVELGTGDLDLEACARAARGAGAEWYVYEHDHPDDPLESLTHGAELLDSLR